MTSTQPDRERRRQLGSWYTPASLVDFVIDRALEGMDGPIHRVLDPSCGDGRFLSALVRRLGTDLDVVGVDVDGVAIGNARSALGDRADLRHGDAFTVDWSTEPPFDLVIGNPPFLSQMAGRSTRGGRSPLGGGPYADTAALFLAMAVPLVRPGGRVAFVLPQSVFATRDIEDIRRNVSEHAALTSLWIAGESVFDASVLTVAVILERSGRQEPVRRWFGPSFQPQSAVQFDATRPTWSHLLAQHPQVELYGHETLASLASATADFRDQYYGLVGHVSDDATGPRLITSGLIDLGRSLWGQRTVRFAKTRYDAPRVALDGLSPAIAAWAASRLVPKLLVATQSKVLEACVDEAGAWLPSVPVLTVTPHAGIDLWDLAAVVCSPVATSWALSHYGGGGLSHDAVKLSARQLLTLPVPARPWTQAGEALRLGRLAEYGRTMIEAYCVDPEPLLSWWLNRLPS